MLHPMGAKKLTYIVVTVRLGDMNSLLNNTALHNAMTFILHEAIQKEEFAEVM